MINTISKQIHRNAVDKGFYESERNIGEMLALIHSEVSEALEADRSGKSTKVEVNGLMELGDDEFKFQFEQQVKSTFEDELADILIRVMDLAGYKKVNLENHIAAKMRYNSLRVYKHGKKY